MKIILPCLFFLLLAAKDTPASIGLADWSGPTPYGGEINHGTKDFTFLRLKDGKELDELGSWYFYKGNTIGILVKFYNDTLGYFVADEKNFIIHTFSTKAQWEYYLFAYDLRPPNSTYWYSSVPGSSAFALDAATRGFINSICLFIAIVILVILSMVVLLISSERAYFRKERNKVLVVFLFLACIGWLMYEAPQIIGPGMGWDYKEST